MRGLKECKTEYFEYLCDLVCYDESIVNGTYNDLLQKLFQTRFIWVMPKDENRAEDGKDLRNRYEYQIPGANLPDVFFKEPCSILEMMVALSLRCEEEIMDDPDEGNRTGLWFWSMIDSLGLGNMTDEYYNEEYVSNNLDIFMNRRYAPNGRGGLFIVDDPDTDMRSIEIWYQMHCFLNYSYT